MCKNDISLVTQFLQKRYSKRNLKKIYVTFFRNKFKKKKKRLTILLNVNVLKFNCSFIWSLKISILYILVFTLIL